MSLQAYIKKNIERMNYELRNDERYWQTSSGAMLLLRELKQVIPQYCKGIVLDAGAGHLLYKNILTPHCLAYESMDFTNTHPDLTYVADIQNMPAVPSDRYDFVFSRNVLEHVPHPSLALGEIGRVLKRGGYGVITVPYLGYLHNEPHDYWRFTKYALANIAQENNLEVISIKEIGGLISFNAYIFQTIFMGIFYGIPVIGFLAFWVNYIVQKICIFLDKIFGMKKLFPLDYLLIIRKKTI